VVGDRAVVGASMAGERERDVGDELTGGSAGEREKRARVREERCRQAWPTRQWEGERKRTCGRDRLTGGDCLSARARAQAGPTWAK
jgi:hypothetical protein